MVETAEFPGLDFATLSGSNLPIEIAAEILSHWPFFYFLRKRRLVTVSMVTTAKRESSGVPSKPASPGKI